MALIKPYKQISPTLDPTAMLAENATVVGDVEIGTESSVWYNAVLRGDVQAIRVGAQTNIQDLVMVHVSTGRVPCLIGDRVTVGHSAILHGCTVEDEALIGMGAVVLDEAVVSSRTLVGAKALVPEGMHLESGFLYLGVPARKIRPLHPGEIAQFQRQALHYVEVAREQRWVR